MSQESASSIVTSAQPNSSVLDFTPPVDIFENSEEILLLADVPGATAERVSIDVEREQLRLVAQASGSDGTTIEYRRLFRIGTGVSADRIDANLKDGVLTVKLPKSEAYKPRKIEVRAS